MPITITAKREGFRRCGMAHHKEPTTHPDGTFTKEQLEILAAEPMLTVTEGKQAMNAKETIAAAKECQSVDDLEAMLEGEERKTVKEAIEARIAELKAAGAEE